MKLLDTDCYSEASGENIAYAIRFEAMDPALRGIAVVTAEEVSRGWLAKIRTVQASDNAAKLLLAYRKFQDAISAMRGEIILPYTTAAHVHYLRLKSQKLRVGTRDLRIASIALAHGATLVTRNRRDFDLVPSLPLEVWN